LASVTTIGQCDNNYSHKFHGLAQNVQGVAIPTPYSAQLQIAVRSRIPWRSECIEWRNRNSLTSSSIRRLHVRSRSQV